jgi:Tfp pilus assembly PilM family ATPase
MGFSMFSAHASPIALDFGSSCIKVLQVSSGEPLSLVAAAQVQIPEPLRSDQEKLFNFYAEAIPSALSAAKVKGKRCVCSVSSSQTFIQHMQLAPSEGLKRDDLIKAQLQFQMNVAPSSVVVRAIDVCDVYRDGQLRHETICLAMSRDTVMRYVEILRKAKLEVVGVHPELTAMVRAFAHLHRRDGDENITTMYVDLGWGGTRTAIGHGKSTVFARNIQIGGKHFDQHIADHLHCDLSSARAHRLSQQVIVAPAVPLAQTEINGSEHDSAQGSAILAGALSKAKSAMLGGASGGVATLAPERRAGAPPIELRHEVLPGEAITTAANVDFSELLDALTDELLMCRRYHQSLFPGRPIDRLIFLGGEAAQIGFCQHIARALRLPAQLGDPMARLKRESSLSTPGVALDRAQPGWAVAFGLCSSPTDL